MKIRLGEGLHPPRPGAFQNLSQPSMAKTGQEDSQEASPYLEIRLDGDWTAIGAFRVGIWHSWLSLVPRYHCIAPLLFETPLLLTRTILGESLCKKGVEYVQCCIGCVINHICACGSWPFEHLSARVTLVASDVS